MDLFRLSRKSKLYLTLFLLVHFQLVSVLCRDQNPTDENVSSKSPSEKAKATKTDDNKDALVNKQDNENKEPDNLSSPSDLIENVTDKASSNRNEDKENKVTPSANDTKTKETEPLDQKEENSAGETLKADDENENDSDEINWDDDGDDFYGAGQNFEKVFKKIKLLAEKKENLADLVKLYEHSNLDISNMLVLVRDAAKLGYDFAKLILAKLHFYGDVIDMDLDEAFRLFNELSLKGNADAHLVSLIYSILLFQSKLTFFCFVILVSWLYVFSWTRTGQIKSSQGTAALHIFRSV